MDISIINNLTKSPYIKHLKLTVDQVMELSRASKYSGEIKHDQKEREVYYRDVPIRIIK